MGRVSSRCGSKRVDAPEPRRAVDYVDVTTESTRTYDHFVAVSCCVRLGFASCL